MKRIAILGSTGSIGRSALAVVAAHPTRLTAVALAAGENAALVAEQVDAFRPALVGVSTQAAHDDLQHSLSLFYSNRKPEDAPFLEELQEMERNRRGSFQLVATMTGPADPTWSGRVGTINAELIESVRVPPAMPIFYIAGPPAMVAAMRGILNGMGVEDDDIRSEDFSGY